MYPWRGRFPGNKVPLRIEKRPKMEESALHPHLPFRFGKGSATSCRHLKNFQISIEAVKYYCFEASLNFDSRKYEQKCMSRRSQVFAICNSRMCLRMPQISKFSCRMHPRLEIRRPGTNFSAAIRSGLVGVGPRYALFFYLLRCR